MAMRPSPSGDETLTIFVHVCTYIYIYIYPSEGFPRTGYFASGRDGTGAWRISGTVALPLFYEGVCVFVKIFEFGGLQYMST